MSLLATVRQANRPGPPEHGVVLRVSATVTVVIGIAACWSQGELKPTLALASMALVVAGNLFSYWRRANPLPGLKALLAVAVTVAFVWFFLTVSRPGAGTTLSTVEGPLAVLFTVIQVTHAFDVPSRRDLAFSLAGSATLMAAAAAQAIDSSFLGYVVLWSAFGILGLYAMWCSMAGGARLRPGPLLASGAVVLVVSALVVALLPATHATSAIVFPSTLAGDVPLATPASLVGSSQSATQQVEAANASGETGVGGYLGFAGPLDTALRGRLSDQVIFRVRADRPSFWVAETFNEWNGTGWSQTAPRAGGDLFVPVLNGPPFSLPIPSGENDHGDVDYQTFYIAVSGPNLIFHAQNASEIWFPASRLYVASDGTIRAGTSLGTGSVYTVASDINTATPAELQAAGTVPSAAATLSPEEVLRYTELPRAYPRVHALAEQITAGLTGTYAKVVALEDWIGTHTRYTTDIPPLQRGQDTVVQFLFGSRRGFCEQISTALAVMLRSLDIPAREAAGYVPGPYNPLTDLYEEQARDAHAWVQVWFPGYGWQSFDPTAVVPEANPTPGDVLAHDTFDAVRRIPPAPVGAAAVVAVVGALTWRWRRRRPKSWAQAMTRELVRAARRSGLKVERTEALTALGTRLEARFAGFGPPPPGPAALAAAAETAAFGAHPLDRATERRLLSAARQLRRRAKRLPPVSPAAAPEPRRTSPREPVGAGRP